MGDLLKVAFAHTTQSSGNASGEDLVLTGSSLNCTILSISICNITTTDSKFSMYIRVDNGSTVRRIYQQQDLPAKATFIHNSKLVLDQNDTLNIIETQDNAANFDVVVSYLEQT